MELWQSLPAFEDLNPIGRLHQHLLKRVIERCVPLEHVAIIQDGNRRYARSRGIATLIGHTLGAKTTDNVADWCLELEIKHLTVYTFSTENFGRPEEEKEYLFDLIERKLLELCESERVHENRVRVQAIGRMDLLPLRIQKAAKKVENTTQKYDNMYFNVALAYGGQCELVDAAKALATQVEKGNIKPEGVDENLIGQHLYPSNDHSLPKVDLMIRTGGEVRTSNFLPWQANGNECAACFCAPYWPQFSKIDFLRALRIAQTRKALTDRAQINRLNYH